jgi:hypothetical protein
MTWGTCAVLLSLVVLSPKLAICTSWPWPQILLSYLEIWVWPCGLGMAATRDGCCMCSLTAKEPIEWVPYALQCKKVPGRLLSVWPALSARNIDLRILASEAEIQSESCASATQASLHPSPTVGSNPAASIPLGFICDQAFACPRTHIYKMIFTVSVVNVW